MEKPEAAQPPCKTFNKKKAITCYALRFNIQTAKFDHYEMYRISNETPGEFYLLPKATLQKSVRVHYSYHKSGVFHWKQEGGPSVRPLDGEADARRADLLVQAANHLHGQLDGYCIARGRNVSDDSIDAMIEIMDGYVIPPLRRIGVNIALRERSSFSICLIDTPYRRLAQRLVADAVAKGERSLLSEDNVKSVFEGNGIPREKLVLLEPKAEFFAVYPEDVMAKLLGIGRALVDEKMEAKPKAFWATFKATDLTDPKANL